MPRVRWSALVPTGCRRSADDVLPATRVWGLIRTDLLFSDNQDAGSDRHEGVVWAECPVKDSRPYTSQFQLSGTDLNLHPDDRFTLRDPTARQLVGLRQRGRPAKDYIREFQKLAGRLRSWPDRLLVHHFRNGLDNEIRRACIVRGIGGRLTDWFKAAMELDIGLREHSSGRENRPPPRRSQDQPTGRTAQAAPETVRPKAVFRCFRCNRPGHRAAECGLPAIPGTPTAIGKPGSTPQKTAEKSRVAHQMGQTPIQPPSGDHSPGLQEYEEDGPVEDPTAVSVMPRVRWSALVPTGCRRSADDVLPATRVWGLIRTDLLFSDNQDAGSDRYEGVVWAEW
ncbi:Retrotransposon-derived protein PEG10 [Crotalus adamanteus]|uniref:Retrotransposon-derived protein PEG10 n=1 Tax=Crotalus adamanteus TaxID=8729 RepID=A0AAW1B191_CROAD